MSYNTGLYDTTTENYILGAILKDPSLLHEDSFPLNPYDFNNRRNRIIFGAAMEMANQGVETITLQDIDSYLMRFPEQYKVFNDNDGIQTISIITENVNTDKNLYAMNYERLQKFSILRDLERTGINTKQFYNPDNLFSESNANFEELSAQSIIDKVKEQINDIEEKHENKKNKVGVKASDGIFELIKKFKVTPEIGEHLDGEIYNYAVRGARYGKFYLNSAPSGHGKALPNSTLIPTPQGYRRVGDIKVGDYLFDAEGKPTKVLGVYPQGKKEVWEIKLKDGRTAKCCEEHLWSYNTAGQRNKNLDTLFTKELKEINQFKNSDGTYNILLPRNKFVEYAAQNHLIPSYSFGLLLGDGSFRISKSNKNLSFSSQDEELVNYICQENNWNSIKYSAKNYDWYFTDANNLLIKVTDILKEYPELIDCYLYKKFIPKEYLQDSYENRINLLSGLIDSDGTVTNSGKIIISTSSELLKQNIQELAFGLGFSATVTEDNHRDKINYQIQISGRPEDKIKLSKLSRKHEKLIKWFNNNKRKEKNTHIPIISKHKLNYQEEMTCFTVDNPYHLFLTENYIVTHNTRHMVGHACNLAYPHLDEFGEIVTKEEYFPVLFIPTEQDEEEIQTLILSCISGVNEKKIITGDYSSFEEERLLKAAKIMEIYSDNFFIEPMPDPTIGLVKTKILKYIYKYNIHYVFYDYIFSSPGLLGEFRDLKIREDVALMMLSNSLKEIATEYQIFVMSATQLSGEYEKAKFRNANFIRGSKAVADKVDVGSITMRLSEEEKERVSIIANALDCKLTPNIVTDIYKNRRGDLTDARIFSYFDYGTCRIIDLFVTDISLNVITEYKVYEQAVVRKSLDELLMEREVKDEI